MTTRCVAVRDSMQADTDGARGAIHRIRGHSGTIQPFSGPPGANLDRQGETRWPDDMTLDVPKFRDMPNKPGAARPRYEAPKRTPRRVRRSGIAPIPDRWRWGTARTGPLPPNPGRETTPPTSGQDARYRHATGRPETTAHLRSADTAIAAPSVVKVSIMAMAAATRHRLVTPQPSTGAHTVGDSTLPSARTGCDQPTRPFPSTVTARASPPLAPARSRTTLREWVRDGRSPGAARRNLFYS
jgi:hypothetical protein